MIWGSTLASSIVNSSLGLNTFLVSPPMVKKISEVAFLTGQPLGYYGSWSLFSLSHHYIVWLATLKAYPLRSTPFVDYALLGDDILITDKKVANQYTLSPDVTIDQLFDVPMCATSWKRSNEDYELIKFGYVWKCYDMGAEESGSARYGYETGYARTGPHLDLHMDNLLYYPKESYSYPGHFVLERASSV
ncbi:hypothetical protein RDI58_032122 [Solanum bulbocastanum]|uniref:Uncharacterized protein n=1 Tax=Solanum bulbocastanum TaxID=147425 RepID=A0AAN8SR92_SOLBU